MRPRLAELADLAAEAIATGDADSELRWGLVWATEATPRERESPPPEVRRGLAAFRAIEREGAGGTGRVYQ